MFNNYIGSIDEITTFLLLTSIILIIIIIIKNTCYKDNFSNVNDEKILMINDNYDDIESPLDITTIDNIEQAFIDQSNSINTQFESLNLNPDFSNFDSQLDDINNLSIKYDNDPFYIHMGCVDSHICNIEETTGLAKTEPNINLDNYWVGILNTHINRIGRWNDIKRKEFKIYKEE